MSTAACSRAKGPCDLAALVLRDSGHLQAEDARYAGERGFSKHDPPRALYDEADADAAVEVLQPVPFGTPTRTAGAEVELRPAGHILGSSTALVRMAGRTALVVAVPLVSVADNRWRRGPGAA